ncbi:hypothetical protein QR680_007912 [Steinernema hermaphroditum]|uniref:Serpentine receptor class gamma n=1 Tax=Steinernema hermaphroditum TaxID=289476 RepID=A0AA39IEM4_9BILA|nr:hypothetical protein QR680_007912 [Steinernema hermaphroditum]
MPDISKLVIQLSYGIPSLILYIIHSALYLTNIIQFRFPLYECFHFLYRPLAVEKETRENVVFAKTLYFLGFYCNSLQIIGQAFIAFNRFTAITFPQSYQNLWKTLLPVSIGASLVLPFTVTWHILPAAVYLYYDPEHGYVVNYVKIQGVSTSLNLTVLYFTVCFVCLPLNAAGFTIYVYRHRSLRVSRGKTEWNLFVLALFMFLCSRLLCWLHHRNLLLARLAIRFHLSPIALPSFMCQLKCPPGHVLVFAVQEEEKECTCHYRSSAGHTEIIMCVVHVGTS